MTRLPPFVVAFTVLGSLIVPGSAGEDAKALKGTFGITFMSEKWTITFDGERKFTLRINGDLMVEGVYQVNKDKITFNDQGGPLKSDQNSPGTYKWRLLGERLTFTLVKDPVEDRVTALTNGPWSETKVEIKDTKKVILKVEGQLTDSDKHDKVKRASYHKVHTIKLLQGGTYQIDMIGAQGIDAFLRLEDANEKQLAEDDDSGGNLNARIIFRAPKTDTYRIICTCCNQNTAGGYTLIVTQMGGPTEKEKDKKEKDKKDKK